MSRNALSIIIGRQWHAESPEVKAYFKQLAEEGEIAHALKHPEYKYRPRTGKRKEAAARGRAEGSRSKSSRREPSSRNAISSAVRSHPSGSSDTSSSRSSQEPNTSPDAANASDSDIINSVLSEPTLVPSHSTRPASQSLYGTFTGESAPFLQDVSYAVPHALLVMCLVLTMSLQSPLSLDVAVDMAHLSGDFEHGGYDTSSTLYELLDSYGGFQFFNL